MKALQRYAGISLPIEPLLLVLVTGQMLTITARLVLSPLVPSITESLQLSSAAVGLALSAMWAMTAVIQYPSGRYADTVSRKTILVGSFGVLLGSIYLISVAEGYWTFLLGTSLLGASAGMYAPANFSQLSDLFSDRQGQALGINEAFVNLGGVAASGLAVLVLAIAVWEAAFVPIGLLAILVAVSIHFGHSGAYGLQMPELDLLETVVRFGKSSNLHGILLASVFYNFVWQGVASFLPTFLQAAHQISSANAGRGFALIFIAGFLSNPIAGRLGDRIGYLRIANVTVLFSVAGILILIMLKGPFLLLGLILLGIGLTAFWPVVMAIFMIQFPDATKAGDVGVVIMVSSLIGSIGPAYVGFIADRLSYLMAFTGFLIPLTFCLVLLGIEYIRVDDMIGRTTL